MARNPMQLYPIENPYEKARGMMGLASNSYSRMGQNTKSETTGPGKTAGGAMMAGMGGAAGGATVGSAIAGGAASGSAGGWYGAAIGAVVGLAAYYLS